MMLIALDSNPHLLLPPARFKSLFQIAIACRFSFNGCKLTEYYNCLLVERFPTSALTNATDDFKANPSLNKHMMTMHTHS